MAVGEYADTPLVRVPSVADMDDPTLIKHMEARHDEDVAVTRMGWNGDPDDKRDLRNIPWRTFHNKMHELYDGRTDGAAGMYDHEHKEPSDA